MFYFAKRNYIHSLSLKKTIKHFVNIHRFAGKIIVIYRRIGFESSFLRAGNRLMT